MVALFLIFKENSIQFSIVAISIYIPTNSVGGFCFLHTLSCCYSVTQLCPTLCYPMNCSTPDSSVLYYLPEFAQTHVHWVIDAIQPSHPLLTPSLLSLNLSQHQGLFQWVDSSHQVATVLQLQHQSFWWIFRVDHLQDWLVWSPHCPRYSQESSLALQFQSINSSGTLPSL